MRVTFLLPNFARAPVGGYKIVFELSNRLCARGVDVTLLFPRSCALKSTPAEHATTALWILWRHLADRARVPWFRLDPRVRCRFLPDARARFLPDGDALVATAWRTAKWVAEAPARTGQKLYLLQHYETWDGPEADVRSTWHLPLHKIVVSRWLWELAASLGVAEQTTFIPCGLDFDHFRILQPIEARRPRIGMMYHAAHWKGSEDGIAAMEVLRVRHPHLEAVLYGTPPRPANLPEWAEYVREPARDAHVRLYNSCSIFVQPSWSEGWGLPATEAMMCGCALVTTDNGGSRTYAVDGETALVAPVRDPLALADRVSALLCDDALRQRVATKGHQHVQQFTWERMVAAASDVLERVCHPHT